VAGHPGRYKLALYKQLVHDSCIRILLEAIGVLTDRAYQQIAMATFHIHLTGLFTSLHIYQWNLHYLCHFKRPHSTNFSPVWGEILTN